MNKAVQSGANLTPEERPPRAQTRRRPRRAHSGRRTEHALLLQPHACELEVVRPQGAGGVLCVFLDLAG